MFGKDPFWHGDSDSDEDDRHTWQPKEFFNGEKWKNHGNHYNHNHDDDDDYFGLSTHYYIVIGALVVVIFIFIVFCVLPCTRKKFRKMCKKKNGPNVTTTTITQHHAPSPQVIPPYPIDARHPTPANAPMTGFNTHQPPYPTHTPNMPFPQGQAPYPATGHTPYPPAPYQSNDYSANPPPYDVAVAQPPIQPPPAKDGYGKQAPYNPSYN